VPGEPGHYQEVSVIEAGSTIFSFPATTFPPLALGFFGLGTGYLIYGPQELSGFPGRDRRVDLTTGIWGVWMPGFMQFLTGLYLFAGLVIFHSITAAPLYMAALAFTAYGVHWFAIGMARAFGSDARPNAFMCVAFFFISLLGTLVFFHNKDNPVGGLFVGLMCVYVSEFFASLGIPLGERVLGFFHTAVGLWLMYLTFAVTLNFTSHYSLPV
jgi:hypothetical protein